MKENALYSFLSFISVWTEGTIRISHHAKQNLQFALKQKCRQSHLTKLSRKWCITLESSHDQYPINYIQYLIQSHLAKYVWTVLLHLMLVHLIAIGWWSKNHLGRHTQTSDADCEHNKMPSIAVLFVAQVHHCDIHKRCRMARVLSRQWFWVPLEPISNRSVR